MRVAFLFIFFLMSLSAQAEVYTSSSDMVNVCASLTKILHDYEHKPEANVNLNAFEFNKDDRIITIPIEIESLQAMGLGAALPDGLGAKPDLGAIELYPDGRIFYNGQEIQTQSLKQICNAGQINAQDVIEGYVDE